MRRYRRNSDERLRALERAVAAGDRDAKVALHQELVRSGKAAGYYAEPLLEDFIDDLQAFRSHTRLANEYATAVLLDVPADEPDPAGGTVLIASPGGAEGHGAQLSIPGPWGRERGLMLSMQVMPHRRNWSGTGAPSIVQVHEARAGGTELPFDSPVNPLYFFHRNSERWGHALTVGGDPERIGQWIKSQVDRKMPIRMFCTDTLASEYGTRADALDAIERALAEAFRDMEFRLGHVDRLLAQVTRRVGVPLTAEGVFAAVQEFSRGQGAVEFLQAAPGPVIGTGSHAIRAWNVSGGGMLQAAMLSLSEHLRRLRAVIRRVQADPYNQEAGWFSRGYMEVTSTRARRTRYPLSFEADWDSMNGFWGTRDGDWIGNEIPPGGLWKIDMTRAPATVQAFYGPAVKWIQETFPSARIMVAVSHESYGRPAYRPL
jgi:hypothetical protein